MSTRSFLSLAIVPTLALVWTACSSEPAGSGGTGAQGGAGGGSSSSSGSAGAGAAGSGGSGGGSMPIPLFETDIVPIFENSCGAGLGACHAPAAYGAVSSMDCRGWLALTNEPLGSKFYSGPDEGKPTGCPDLPLYERLVQLSAWQECDAVQKRYVVPCDVDASYLFDKIDDGPYCGEAPGSPSEPMPKGALMDPAERETIRAWILAGAPRVDGTVTNCGGTGGAGGSGGTGGGMMGQAPQVQINHPGDMEQRAANVDISFIGVANDPEDGALGGALMVWTSNLSGQIGTGTNFNAPLPAGTHTITLKATDSDGNTASDSLVLYIQ